MVSDTLLRKKGVERRMRCSGQTAARIESAFTTVGKLLDAVESDRELTDYDGVGDSTARVIEDWYENRFERERAMDGASMSGRANGGFSITFHNSWAEELGMESEDAD